MCENHHNQFRNMNTTELSRKKIYNLLLSDETCHCEKMWENKLGKKLHIDTWKNIFEGIKETQLQEIQWKIIHNVYPTNILATRIGKTNTENCIHCNERDFVEHFFFNCKITKDLWREINHLINAKLDKTIHLSEHNVILGIEQDIQHKSLTKDQIHYINKIIVLGKFAISKGKKNGSDIKITFNKELRMRNY